MFEHQQSKVRRQMFPQGTCNIRDTAVTEIYKLTPISATQFCTLSKFGGKLSCAVTIPHTYHVNSEFDQAFTANRQQAGQPVSH